MKVAIICAMDKEIERFLELYNPKLIDKDRELYETDNVIIARSGIGKVNAAMTTQYLIDKFSPEAIISSGCAGSLTNELKVLDVILPPYVTYHDFLPERVMRDSTPDEGKIKVDNNLIQIFKDVIVLMDNIRYVETSICSGDCYVTDSKKALEIMERTGAKVVDMESASIAHVSRKNGIPFITIRTISDFADGNDESERIASRYASEIIYKCIEKLLTNN